MNLEESTISSETVQVAQMWLVQKDSTWFQAFDKLTHWSDKKFTWLVVWASGFDFPFQSQFLNNNNNKNVKKDEKLEIDEIKPTYILLTRMKS